MSFKIEDVLANHKFLTGMDDRLVKILASCASMRQFYPEQYIFRQGEKAEHFYLIRSGQIDVEAFSASGGPVLIQSLKDGDVLGWSWLVPPYEWRFDARVVKPTEVVSLDARDLHGIFAMNHELGYELLRRFLAIVAERLESERLQMVSLYGAHS
ncbi:cyclic nucleotide-binding domain-containing protein [bacterium]|nr:cyclic nucleotide-binding domain-containing protein [bacterium]